MRLLQHDGEGNCAKVHPMWFSTWRPSQLDIEGDY
jgi:hypothetical protein